MLLDVLRVGIKVYGPYLRSDGRKHVVLYDGITRKTMSFPRWLLEQRLGRFLVETECVDHINRDFTDNRLENLQLLERREHSSLDAIRLKLVDVFCVLCGTPFRTSPRGRSKKKAGPFCSRRCTGLYGAGVQAGAVLLPRNNIKRSYYKRNKNTEAL